MCGVSRRRGIEDEMSSSARPELGVRAFGACRDASGGEGLWLKVLTWLEPGDDFHCVVRGGAFFCGREMRVLGVAGPNGGEELPGRAGLMARPLLYVARGPRIPWM